MATRQKIAVLGGGISALSAVYEITSQPDWREHYQITVYQMGWRLGGKAASGHDPAHNQRVIEHGLHMWLGVYNNAFNLLWRCYDELGRDANKPLARFEEAFIPVHTYALKETGVDELWVMQFPPNDLVPGKPADPANPAYVEDDLPLSAYWVMFLHVLRDQVAKLNLGDFEFPAMQAPRWAEYLQGWLGETEIVTQKLLDKILDFVGQHQDDLSQWLEAESATLIWLLRQFRLGLRVGFATRLSDTALRRTYITLDFSLTILIGFLVDGALVHGVEPLDEYDIRAWLTKHDANPLTIDSALVRAIYDLLFAYEQGTTPNIVAGSTLSGIMRMVTSYKGAPLWEMTAGTGEVVIAPLYLVLKQRGVQFEFFHRITNLRLNDDQTSVEAIEIARQVNVSEGEYNPLVEVEGLPCWTLHPDYAQLEQGAELEAREVDLESFWAEWDDVEHLVLRQAEDFDTVLFAIPIGAVPYICNELIDHHPHWQAMVRHLKTTETLSLQLWFQRNLTELGWKLRKPLLNLPSPSFSSWCDFSQVLAHETWGDKVRQLSYLVGVLPDQAAEISPPDATTYPQEAHDRVTTYVERVFQDHAPTMWSQTVINGEFDWDALTAPAEVVGPARLQHQYWRANISPTERYALAVAGSTKYRMKTDETGFTNLYVAGDWIYTYLNVPSFEAAVVSGRLAARAITQRNIPIAGVS